MDQNKGIDSIKYLLIPIIWLGMICLAFWFANSALAYETSWIEDFEDYSNSTEIDTLDMWSIPVSNDGCNTTGNCKVQTTQYHDGSKALFVSGHALGSNVYYRPYFYSTENQVASMWLRMSSITDDPTYATYLIFFDSGDVSTGYFKFQGGKVYINSTTDTGFTYSANTWFKFSAKFNFTNEDYYVSVNDATWYQSTTFYQGVHSTNITGFQIWNTANSNFYLDGLYNSSTTATGQANEIYGIALNWSCNISYLSWDPCATFGDFVEDILNPASEAVKNLALGFLDQAPFSYLTELQDAYNSSTDYAMSFSTTSLPLISYTITGSSWNSTTSIPIVTNTSLTDVIPKSIWDTLRPYFNMVLYVLFGWYLYRKITRFIHDLNTHG